MLKSALTLGISLIALVALYMTSKYERSQPCSPEWFVGIDERLQIGDAQGHGPDLGSPEWRAAVQRKLKLDGSQPSSLKPTSDKTRAPQLASDQWCQFIDNYLH